MAPAWPAGRPSGKSQASRTNSGKGYVSRSTSQEVWADGRSWKEPVLPPVKEAASRHCQSTRSDWNESSRVSGSPSPVCTPTRGLPQSPGSRSSTSTAATETPGSPEWSLSFAHQARQRFTSDNSVEAQSLCPPPGNWLRTNAAPAPRAEVFVLSTSPSVQQASHQQMLPPSLPFVLPSSVGPAMGADVGVAPSPNLPRSAPPSSPPMLPQFRDAPPVPPPPDQLPCEETPPPQLRPAGTPASSSRAQSPASAWEAGSAEPASPGACCSASPSHVLNEAQALRPGSRDLWITPPKALGGGASLWQMPISPSKAASKTARDGGCQNTSEVYLIVVNPSNGMLDAFEIPEPCDLASAAQRTRSSPASLSDRVGQKRCADRSAMGSATKAAQDSMEVPCPRLLGSPRRFFSADNHEMDCSEV